MEEIIKILSQIKPFIDEEIEKSVPKTGDPQVLFEGSWHYIGSGGKRWRPAIMALACEALGGNAKDIVPAGAAIEIAHTFLLIHDDIEDFSDIRRGKPAMHVKYGTSQAINIGDYLFMKSYEAVLKGEKVWGPEKTMKIMNYLTEMYLRTGEGQGMEIDQRDKDLSEATFEWYEKMCLHKTGYYSGGMPCAIGAIIANGTDEQIEILKNFGFATAVAFQIQDDILNLTEAGEGKSQLKKDFAEDIKEGKRTLILVHAFQNADENDKQRLKELVGKKDITLEEKVEVIDIFRKYDSINYAKNYARDITKKAIEGLRRLPENEGRKKLEAMATFLIEREF